MMKPCFKCKKVLPLSEFYEHPATLDGHLNKCKECTRTDVRLNRKSKIAYYRAYDVQRAKRKDRKLDAAARTNARRRAVPMYQKAHNIVARAMGNGVLKRKPCQMCGTRKSVHAHHDDYKKPLDVMWLCPVHHRARHDFLSYHGIETF